MSRLILVLIAFVVLAGMSIIGNIALDWELPSMDRALLMAFVVAWCADEARRKL